MNSSRDSRIASLWARARRRLVRAAQGLEYRRRSEQTRALDQLSHADDILFLCYGNICRSPFAERLARGLLPPSVRVASAGVHPIVGRPSPSAATSAAASFGVDLDGHRSQLVTPRMLDEVDLIFVFDARNYLDLRRRQPETRRKAHFLGNLDFSGPLEISDPWGGSEEGFVETYRRIRRAVEAVASATRLGSGRP